MTLLAFHNDLKIKEKYVSRVLDHYEGDEIIKGIYWEKGKGCAVGCTVHSPDHSAYETELGIPTWLAKVEDKIFEGLPNERAKKLPIEFLSSIHPGADLNLIKAPFLIFIMESTLDKFDHIKHPLIKRSIEAVIALYRNPLSTSEDFRLAAHAAYAAAYATAYTSDAYATAAAYAAAYAASDAYATAAAYAAAYADAYAYATGYAAASATTAAAYACYIKFADKLIELLSNCRRL